MPVPTGRLYVTATPIGNTGDITVRALDMLKTADAVICEELRQGSTLLKKVGVKARELIALNEHNEQELVPELVQRMLLNNHVLCLISDAGTPVFADPGQQLISRAVEMGIPVSPLPGASSLMAALSVLDFKLERFVFGGFLPREPELRRKEMAQLRGLRMAVVLMDTPYRLSSLLQDVNRIFGKNQAVTLAMDLTLPNELILRGPVSEVLQQVNARKAEFILIIHA